MSQTEKPPRVMRSFGATLMSVNGMIGAGIFALPALLYNEAGNFSPWLFLIFGLFYACNVLVVARLASLFRASGGPQLYAETAFGPFTGFQVGWILVIAMAAGRAATLYVLVSYLAVIFPLLEGPVARPVAMLALLAILSGISVSGMRNSITGLGVGTVLKLTPILILCGFGIATGNVATQLVLPDFETFESVALLVFFAFSGTISATFCAGEVKDPGRTIPRSMLLSLVAIILLYMLVQFAYIAAGPPNDGGDATPLAAAAGVVFGQAGLIAMTLGAIFSIATNALTFFISGPRVIYAMADRGLLPHSLSGISERYRTPHRAIALFTLIVAGIALTGVFASLGGLTTCQPGCLRSLRGAAQTRQGQLRRANDTVMDRHPGNCRRFFGLCDRPGPARKLRARRSSDRHRHRALLVDRQAAHFSAYQKLTLLVAVPRRAKASICDPRVAAVQQNSPAQDGPRAQNWQFRPDALHNDDRM